MLRATNGKTTTLVRWQNPPYESFPLWQVFTRITTLTRIPEHRTDILQPRRAEQSRAQEETPSIAHDRHGQADLVGEPAVHRPGTSAPTATAFMAATSRHAAALKGANC